MPVFTLENGSQAWIPGLVEFKETVVETGIGPVPAFLVPLILGDAYEGHPYNADDSKYDEEGAYTPFKACYSAADVRAYYGNGCDLHTAMSFAKNNGLPMAYTVCISPLTRAKIVVLSAKGPDVAEFDLYSRKWGAPGNWHKATLAINAGKATMTIQPVKNFAMLSATAAIGATRLYLAGYNPTSWLKEGATITVGDNVTAGVTKVISQFGKELDSNGQYRYFVDITVALAAQVQTGDDAIILEYGDSIVSPEFDAGDCQGLIDWVNASGKVLGAHKLATFTGALPLAAAVDELKEITEWGAATAGTSPTVADADWDDFLTNYENTYWDEFRQAFGVTPYKHLVLSGSSTTHGYWKNFAIERRDTNLTPIDVLTGCTFTDTDTTAAGDTNPIVRARTLNHQDISLFAGQAYRLAPYLSLAAIAFGQQVGGGVKYAITNKSIGASPEITKIWTKAQRVLLTQAGVVTYQLRMKDPTGWVFIVDANTNQANLVVWDASTNTCCLQSVRTIANRYEFGLRNLLTGQEFSGNTALDANKVGSRLSAYDQSALKNGFITRRGDPTIEVNSQSASVQMTPDVTYPGETLFLSVNVLVNVG